MLADTDGDGLTDGREHDLGTDPESVDTDTDSIEDARELEVGEDPTLHDFSPPTITVLSIEADRIPDQDNQSGDLYDVEYQVIYRADDPSGVSRTAVFKNDVRRAVEQFDGLTGAGHQTSFVFESFAQYLAEAVFAPQASVKAVDIHGNDQRVVERDSAFYALLAQRVPKVPGVARKLAGTVLLTPVEFAGILAGFTYGVGQSVNDIVSLVRNPDQLLAFIDLALLLVENLGAAKQVVLALLDSFNRFQRVQNPFDGPQNLLNPLARETYSNDNSTFGRGWFSGYAGAFATLGVLGGSAAATVLARIGSVFPRVATALRLLVNPLGVVTSRGAGLLGRTALRVAVRIGRATELRVGAVKRALDGLPTPRQVVARETLPEVGEGRLATVREAELGSELTSYLSVTGESGLRALRRVDGGDLRELLDRFGETPELGEALARRGVPIEQLESNLHTIDLSGSQARKFFGSDGDLSYTLVRGTFTETLRDIDVGVRYVESREALARRFANDPEDLSDGSIAERLGEEILAKKGYDVYGERQGFDKDPSDPTEPGIDLLAKDGDTWVIGEAKYDSNVEAVGNDLLSTSAFDGNPQLSDDWVVNSLENMIQRGTIDEDLAREIIDDIVEDGVEVRREVVFVRDASGAAGRTLRSPESIATDISEQSEVDAVEIVDLQTGTD